MPRNGFFGVRSSHFAILTDEDKLTYETPVPVEGTVEIKMETSVETATSYADNEPWIQKQQDNGGSGTMSFYDVESTSEVRALLAKITGYVVASDGRMILAADETPKPFAFMCEQTGHVVGKRRCLLKCQLSKPSMDAKTTADKPDISQLDFDFTWVPVRLPGGVRASGYDSYSDLDGYDTFFAKVDTDVKPAPPAPDPTPDPKSVGGRR